ncbi:hypothetical protein GWR56_06730 [Mucilaginibacter sp. 14171R-50]|jgi:hypothetical protein|uniref:hypothetical protein n=1 Tax=Mucilaginibacter sp. 14171R-50 TaxID=2703789 RepID=UPI00138C0503|nr:hypothetical protein [Mucilaginibacter sp. 14171R-50]QHS55249.1 hypothetical protein GWR56_06730 [Mucilaginibacter sp. 14171R-50]
MKKICAIALISFYLLLATGAYACVLHCATDYFAAKFEDKHNGHPADSDHRQDDKESDEDCRSGNCNCCYHHGTYVVKEVAKSATHFSLTLNDFGIPLLPNDDFFYIPLKITNKVSWPRATGPPFVSSRPIYLFKRTFLI